MPGIYKMFCPRLLYEWIALVFLCHVVGPYTLCDSHPFRLEEDVGLVWAVPCLKVEWTLVSQRAVLL